MNHSTSAAALASLILATGAFSSKVRGKVRT